MGASPQPPQVLECALACLLHFQEECHLLWTLAPPCRWPLEQWQVAAVALTGTTKGWPSRHSKPLGPQLEQVDPQQAVPRRLALPLPPEPTTPARLSAWLPDTGGTCVEGLRG